MAARTHLIAGALLAASPALAMDTYMLGGGPRLGTTFLPGSYPITFPTMIANYDFVEEGEFAGPEDGENKGRDRDPATGDFIYTSLEEVGFDLNVGGDFVYYINKDMRVGTMLGLGFGKRFFDVNLLLKYDAVVVAEDTVDVFVGGGAGFGSMTFTGEIEPERLRVPYYPLRLHFGAMLRDKTRAYQLSIFGQSAVPGNQIYTNYDGDEIEKVGGAFSLFSYLSMGIEGSVMFGDFTRPKKGGGKAGKKKGGGKGDGGGRDGGDGRGGGKGGGGKKGGGKKGGGKQGR